MKTSSKSTRRHGAVSTKSSLALAIVAALLGCATIDATAASTSAPATLAHPVLLSRGDAVLGALPMSHPMHVVVGLKLRNKAALDVFVAAKLKSQANGVTTPSMTSAQILANHAPTQQQAQTVANYLTAMGFTNVRITGNRMLVTADGTAATAGRAFLTSFSQVRTHDGRVAFANRDDIRVPAALNGMVQSVLGLQNVHQLHTFATAPKALPAQAQTPGSARTAGSVHPEYTNYYYPDEYPAVYAADTAETPANVTVGIISEGDMTATISNLNHYTDGRAYARVATSVLNTGTTSSDTSGTVEWNLDSQTIVGLAAGQVQGLNFYTMPDMTNGSLVDIFNKVVQDNAVKIANVSLGECELGAQGGFGADAADAIFEVGVAQGQTFSVSTGDFGADECSDGGVKPSWPANSQYVVAVAGTNLIAGLPGRANSKAWATESEWTGSGGSESTYEPKPSWQTLWSGTHRGVADVAFDADPNTGGVIYINATVATSGGPATYNGSYIVGGTSLAAPIFSGLWSRVLQQVPKIGFAGPVIYGLNSADFHDITSGSNGISAGPGYDLASGRGSMIFSSVIADILANRGSLGNQRPVAGFSWVRTGQTFSFTDTSTDDSGVIASHAWNFGDGTTSTAANPTHYYPVAGTYLVREVVTDQVGLSTPANRSFTAGPVQEAMNTGFESGSSSWSISPSSMLTNNSSQAHAGNWYVALGGDTNAPGDSALQRITLPGSATTATLSFYVHITSSETTTTAAHDKLSVQVTQPNGQLLATLAQYSNLDSTGGYVLENLDMSAYLGQTIRVKFVGSNNATLPTTWAIDDVTVNVR